VPKFSSCDSCPYRKVMATGLNELTRKCVHPEFDRPRRIVSGLEFPKWCPLMQEEKDLKTGI